MVKKNIIDKADLQRIKKNMKDFDEKREVIIRISRDILKISKQAIYSVHRGDLKKAGQLVKEAEKNIANVRKAIKKTPELSKVGAFSAAMQEYVEAVCYLGYVKDSKIPSAKKLNAGDEDYLLGLCDLTGELGRRAVISVVNNDFSEIKKIKESSGPRH